MVNNDIIKAVIMGIVEGFTEFLPVSSTGHLILVGELISFTGEKAKLFDVFIQLGAILAIVWIYRTKILSVVRNITRDTNAKNFTGNILIAFMPAAIIGVLVHKYIKAYLFSPFTVSIALILGGVLIIVIEKTKHSNKIEKTDDIDFKTAFLVGCAQVVALFPGISRSGATIMGALLSGMNRKTAAEFSFFLAIPTMFAATLFDLYKDFHLLSINDVGIFATGFISAFVSAICVVYWFIRFISNNNFMVFAYYRIIFGTILLYFYWL
jgi:undecaprenyl-diphosphatase